VADTEPLVTTFFLPYDFEHIAQRKQVLSFQPLDPSGCNPEKLSCYIKLDARAEPGFMARISRSLLYIDNILYMFAAHILAGVAGLVVLYWLSQGHV